MELRPECGHISIRYDVIDRSVDVTRLFCRSFVAPDVSHAMPNGFCLGGHSGRPER